MSKQKVGVSCLSSRNQIPAHAKLYAREYQLVKGISNEYNYLKIVKNCMTLITDYLSHQ